MNDRDQHYSYVRCEVLTAVVMKSFIFWDVTPCSLLKVNQSFRGTCSLILQAERRSQARNQHESRWQAEQISLPKFQIVKETEGKCKTASQLPLAHA
jgi:hypothetical protein